MSPEHRKCRYLSKEQIQNVADQLVLRHFGELVDPPVEVDYLLEQAGFVMELKQRLPHEGVFSELAIDGRTIKVLEPAYSSSGPNYYHCRFSLAHELGHGLLHQDALEEMRAAYKAGMDEYFHYNASIGDQQYAYFEKQANLFAGQLLVHPLKLEAELVQEIEKLPPEQRQALFEFTASEVFSWSKTLFRAIGEVFEVNPSCILVRIEQEALWSKLAVRYQGQA